MGVAVVTLAGTAAGGSTPVRVLHDAAAGTIQPARLVERTTGPDGQVRTVTKRLPSISAGTLRSASDAAPGPLPAGVHAQAPTAAPSSVVAGLSPATLGFDSRGRAYFSCVTFDSNTNASGLFVTASPAGAKGSYFFNIDTGTQPDNRPIDRRFKVVEDNSPLVAHDKNFLAVDAFPSSP